MKIKNILLIGVLLVLTGTVLFAMKSNVFFKERPAIQPKAEQQPKAIHYDAALLKKLDTLNKLFDINRRTYAYSGTISVADKTDTSKSVKKLSFTFCKNNSDVYYKLGDTESFNGDNMYLYLDHKNKKVLITAMKKLQAFPLFDINKFKATLGSEQYELLSTANGKLQTIKLVNEHHVSCKEYSVTFDTTSYKVTRVRSRLTNLAKPYDKTYDKIIDVELTDFSDKGVNIISYLNRDNIIEKSGTAWKLTPAYKDYELIKL